MIPNKQQSEFLKLIAIIAMLIDHVGLMFFPDIIIFRIIGRLALPIFTYQISLGYIFSSNLKKYALKLFILAVISQIPFTLFNRGLEFHPFQLNIIFTLLLGMAAIKLYEKKKYFLLILLILIPEVITIITGGIFKVSYGIFGVLLVLLLYMFKNNFYQLAISYVFLSFYNTIYVIIHAMIEYNAYENILRFIKNNYFSSGVMIQLFNILFLPLLLFVDRIKVPILKTNKYLFYIFYPTHMAILILVKYIVN
jgi:hypothetical protein